MESTRDLTDTQLQQLLLCLTTEHSALQSARSTTVTETNGRISLFLGSVSSALIALGFLGQGATGTTAFFLFGAVLFPALFFVGLATFIRVLQATREDLLYARGINRIRHFYLELAPQLQTYLILSPHDDIMGVFRNMGLTPSRWQFVFTGAGMVAVINSVIAGVVVGMLITQVIALDLPIQVGAGIGTFLVSTIIHYRYLEATLRHADQQIPVRFPTTVEDKQIEMGRSNAPTRPPGNKTRED
jgi:hypothetical protein